MLCRDDTVMTSAWNVTSETARTQARTKMWDASCRCEHPALRPPWKGRVSLTPPGLDPGLGTHHQQQHIWVPKQCQREETPSQPTALFALLCFLFCKYSSTNCSIRCRERQKSGLKINFTSVHYFQAAWFFFLLFPSPGQKPLISAPRSFVFWATWVVLFAGPWFSHPFWTKQQTQWHQHPFLVLKRQTLRTKYDSRWTISECSWLSLYPVMRMKPPFWICRT